MAGNRRLTKELDDIGKDPVEGFMVGPVDNDIYHWQAMLDGPVKKEKRKRKICLISSSLTLFNHFIIG